MKLQQFSFEIIWELIIDEVEVEIRVEFGVGTGDTSKENKTQGWNKIL
jgi:hypothetical protein